MVTPALLPEIAVHIGRRVVGHTEHDGAGRPQHTQQSVQVDQHPCAPAQRHARPWTTRIDRGGAIGARSFAEPQAAEQQRSEGEVGGTCQSMRYIECAHAHERASGPLRPERRLLHSDSPGKRRGADGSVRSADRQGMAEHFCRGRARAVRRKPLVTQADLVRKIGDVVWDWRDVDAEVKQQGENDAEWPAGAAERRRILAE